MAIKTKTSSKTKRKLSFKKLRIKQILLIVFILVFAATGAYMVFRSKADSFDVNFETDQYNRINAFRAQNGRGALARSDCLTQAARGWALNMASRKALSHSDLANFINGYCGSGWTSLAENIGQGTSSDSLWDGFINSPLHKDNILSNSTKVGVGVFKFDNYCTDNGWCGAYYYEVMEFGNGSAGWASAPFITDAWITGRVTFNGGPAANVKLNTCIGKYPVTDGNGNYAFTVAPGAGFCVRVASGAPSTWGGPGTNNNLENVYAKTYEYQIANASCYHFCSGSAYTWDRNTDGGYDFNYTAHKSIALKSDGTGYSMDTSGILHPYNGAPKLANGKPGYWRGGNVARAIAMNNNGQGYELDYSGGLHPFGGAPNASGAPYWPGVDVGRDVKLIPGTTKGYILDMSGALHPFNGAPTTTGGAYWAGADVARKFVINSQGTGGYILDAYGGLHPFGIGTNRKMSLTAGGPYWAGWDIARSVILKPDNTGGYVLDGFGGLTPFAVGSNSKPPKFTSAPYWAGWDIARDVTFTSWSGSKPTAFVLDGWGGIHKVTQ